MNFNDHFKTAWHLTINTIVPLIILTLVMFGICILTLGLLAPPMMAGYTYALLRLIRERREPQINDLFSQMKLFLPLLGFTTAAFILTGIGFLILFIPGLVMTLALAFCCIYMVPLMVDQDMKLVDALKESYSMAVNGEVMDHLVLVILYFGIIAIGSSIFVGLIFALPFATLLLLLVYEEKNRPSHPITGSDSP
ncbi:MAG: hypothetical protein C4522_11480 [Desulfobacteraceae bacterium]|nr:MAG: hypothetical protein C4522_11480 [Desulfobacteraceae bacterium]